MDISEKNLEETIEQALLAAVPPIDLDSLHPKFKQSTPLYGALTANLATGDVIPGGYHKRKSEEYDKAHCLLAGDALDFIYATQPRE